MDKNLYIDKCLEICDGTLVYGDKDAILGKFSKDTRTINEGEVYVGIKGENFDGNAFYKDAFEKGASTCILDRAFYEKLEPEIIEDKNLILVDDTIGAIQKLARYKRSLYDIPVIAVTGSVGKTSTRDMIASVLETKYKVLKTKGNYNNNIGLPITILGLTDEEVMVLEMGMNHLYEINLLSTIASPTHAVITNVGTAHIGNLGSRENILKAKLEILDGLKEDGVLFINNDNDMLHDNLKDIKKRCNVITVGIDNKSDYNAKNIEDEVFSSTFKIGENLIEVNAPGKAYVYNSLIAYAIGKDLNVDIQNIKRGIKNFKMEKNRLEKIDTKYGFTIINDTYNASLDSIKNSLDLISKADYQRKVLVLGDVLELGTFSKKIHERIGLEIVKHKVDIVFAIGENVKDTVRTLKEEKFNMSNVYSFDSEDQAHEKIKEILKPGDIVLVKGSNGMHLINIVDDIKGN